VVFISYMCGPACWSATSWCFFGRLSAAERRSKSEMSETQAVRKSLQNSLLLTIPAALLVTYVLVPSVSSSIFKAWSGEAFGYTSTEDHYFLREDASIRCYTSDAHARLRSTASVLVVLWPIGVPVMYAILLMLARKAIRNHTPNHLVRSISFLHRDYKPEYFYWEMVELGRRTILLGWVSFIDEGNAFTRIVVAMAVSLGAFVLTLTQKPYVHEEDQLIAVAGQFMLLTSFIGASYIKSFDEVKARSDAIASAAFGIDSADQIVVMIFSFTVAMILLLTGTLVALVSAEASMPLMRVKGTGKRPVLTLRTRQKWHLFNSHNWNSAQDAAATIKRQLQRLMPGVQVFLDVDDLEDIANIGQHITESAATLMFLSKGYFVSRNCLREVSLTLSKKKPFTLVHELEALRGGAPLAAIQQELHSQEQRNQIFTDEQQIIDWFRASHLQLVSLLQIAEDMLRCTPSYAYMEELSLYMPGSLLDARMEFRSRVLMFASRNNPGAPEVATEVHSTFQRGSFLRNFHVTNGLPKVGQSVRRRFSVDALWRIATTKMIFASHRHACTDSAESSVPNVCDRSSSRRLSLPSMFDRRNSSGGMRRRSTVGADTPRCSFVEADTPRRSSVNFLEQSPHQQSASPAATCAQRSPTEAMAAKDPAEDAGAFGAVKGDRDAAKGATSATSHSGVAASACAAEDVEPKPTHFLLYLNRETFEGAAGAVFADEVRAARAAQIKIVMIHEKDEARGKCADFPTFFETTPRDLIDDGLYTRGIAVGFMSGERHRLVGHKMIAKLLGAEVAKSSLRRMSSSSHRLSSYMNRRGSSLIMGQNSPMRRMSSPFTARRKSSLTVRRRSQDLVASFAARGSSRWSGSGRKRSAVAGICTSSPFRRASFTRRLSREEGETEASPRAWSTWARA